MNRARASLIFVLAAAGALSSCSDPANDPNVEVHEREVGYRGPARTNPFLAAERFLNKMGADTGQHFDLTEMPGYDTPIIVPAESLKSKQIARNLVRWVSEGGHIIYLLDGADSLNDDWGSAWAERRMERGAGGKKDEDDHPLLTLFEIEVTDRTEPMNRVELHGETLDVHMPGGQGVKSDSWRAGPEAAMKSGPEDASAFLSFYYDSGRITVIGNAYPWRNRFIGKNDHAEFLWEVVSLEGAPPAIWLVRGTSISFASLLWSYGWMPLLSLIALIIFWLWRSIPRFGPKIAETEPVSREFSSHLAMSGQFLWKRKAARGLVEPLRRRILKRYREKSVTGDDEKILKEATEELAEKSGLAPNRVRAALETAKPRDPHQLTAVLRDLQKLDTVQ